MDQKELLEKVRQEAARRVERRIGEFKNDITMSLQKLFNNTCWISPDGTNPRREAMEAYFGVSTKWPKSLFENEEKVIMDAILRKTAGEDLPK